MNIKKLAMILFALLLCMGAVAQSYTSKYKMSAFDGSFEVVLVDGGGGAVSAMLHIFTLEDQDFSISIDGEEIYKTIEILEGVKAKFPEWKKTAEENKVKDFEKVFPTETLDVTVAFRKYGEWHLSLHHKFYFAFIVSDDGKCSASYYTGVAKDYSNELYESEGGMISFVSVDEIDGLIKALNPSNVLEKVKEKAKVDALFQ